MKYKIINYLIVLSTICVFSMLVGCGKHVNNKKGGDEYINKKDRYSIDTPEGWIIEEEKVELASVGDLITFYLPDHGRFNPPFIEIYVDSVMQHRSLDETVKLYRKSHTPKVILNIPFEMQDLNAKNTNGCVLLYEYSGNRYFKFYAKHGAKLYMVNCVAPIEEYDAYEAIFKKVCVSLEIIK